jgi:dTDP-4-amino-4,6-dideoxygalactose transaminase
MTPAGQREAEIRLARPDVGADEHDADAAVLESGQLTMGPLVPEFEAELARACGTAHAVAVSSGTAALHLAVLALELDPGDEVLVPAYTFPATANVVALAGLRPVLVDVDPETMNIDPGRIEVGPRTRAILPVHLFGRPARLDQLPEELAVVEDAAGALGAQRRGRPCGSLGLAGCLSFHPRKLVSTGEGGAVVTDDERVASTARRLRHHGWRPEEPDEMPAPGFNYRIPDVLCALGLPQVRRLGELLAARSRVATGYAERLAELPLVLPEADDGDVHGWQAYVVQVERRDEVLAGLRGQGIEAQIGTWALHLLGAYRDQGFFPGAEHAFERALALPFHTTLTESDLDRVAEALSRLVER